MEKLKSNTADREIRMSRLLDAPVKLVWEVWTKPEHIKEWWGPNGFTNTISTMNVEEGGYWNLVMHGPDGVNYQNESVYKEIIKHKKIVYEHTSTPHFMATITFEPQGNKTLIDWHMVFDSKEQFIQVVKTFKADEGLRQNLEKLDHYLSVNYKLRNELQTSTKPRVAVYLNFNGNTEEAFNYYKEIFNGKFSGKGLQRFSDIQLPADGPQMSEADKKLIIHAELTILGNHVLMATDAPESMGFKLESGNNMHINVEPGSREETKRLFDALSEGGNVTMPLEDMFFGAYFGSLTDKYGINWMFHWAGKPEEN